jgi:[CysO sulfur-carrier protein]-S-L-cysteine hydrolase
MGAGDEIRMSGEPAAAVVIPAALREAMFAAARQAFPAECCGFLTGPRGGGAATAMRACDNAQAGGDHPTAADRSAETAYVIAGDDLLALARSLDGPEPALVIYHSHPNGRAYFSATDREVATSPWGDGPAYPCQQVVIGLDGEAVRELAWFAWSDAAGGWIEIHRETYSAP